MLFEKTALDKKIYEEQISEFLPKKLFDIHVHVWKDEYRYIPAGTPKRWPSFVAKDSSIEDLQETYKIFFPDKDVKALIFATTSHDKNSLAQMNKYVEESAKKVDFPALYFSHPKQDVKELESEILKGGFLGVKSYLSLADKPNPGKNARIFDFFPREQLKLLDDMGAIVMCHISKDLRFRDPENLADLKEISQNYKNLKFIVAHIGRAYVKSDLGNALEYLQDCDNLLYDFCANTSDYVMEKALASVGSKRMFFGSDLPILRMRTRRIDENGFYINLVPPKIYGEPGQDPHMREVSEEEAKNLTYFMYEEILAMKRATERLNSSREEIENMFYNNADNLIKQVRKNIYGK